MPVPGPAHHYSRLSDSASTGTGLNAPLRLNASRLNFHGATYALEVASTDRSSNWDPQSLRVSERINQNPNTASLTVFGFTPAYRDEIVIGAGSLSNRLFRGRVISVAQSRFKATQGRVAWQLECQDWTYDLSAALVTQRWTATSASDIASAIISTYTSGFTTRIQQGLATLDSFQATMTPVGDVLTRLADRVGGYWFVDYEQVVHFFTTASSLQPDPQELTTSNRHFSNFRHGEDGDQLHNRVFVEGAGTTTAIDVAVGDTTFPVLDASMFNASGGTLKAEHAQNLTYTGRGVTGTGSRVSHSLAAPGAPTAAASTGIGGALGTYLYRVSLANTTGETVPGTASGSATATDRSQWSGDWVALESGATVSLLGVDYSGSRFVAVGGASLSSAYYSDDGFVWQTSSMTASQTWSGIAYSPELSLWAAVSHGPVNTSPDGETWTARTESTTQDWQDVCWAGGTIQLFVAVGNTGTAAQRVMTSPDGITWTSRTAPSTNSWIAVTYSADDDLVVAVSSTGTADCVMTSSDGTSWTARTTPHNGYVDIGYSTDLGQYLITRLNSTQYATSADAVTWTGRTFPAAYNWYAPVWVPRMAVWVVGSTTTTANAIIESTDGINWTTVDASPGEIRAGVYAANLYRVVLVGQTGDVEARTYTPGGDTIDLTAIPTGASPTTSRRLWRTRAGGSAYYFLDEIADNSTTTYTDERSDNELGALAPTVSTMAAEAGDTTIRVQDLENFLAGGGWVTAGNQYLRYTGRSGSSGEGTLTGIPASGRGAILAEIAGGTEILPAGFVEGVPASSTGSVRTALAAGDSVHLLVQRDDASSQGTYGVREHYIQDRRLSEAEANNRGDATLVLHDLPRTSGGCTSTDPNARAGKNQAINIYGLNETRRIQSVDISIGVKPMPLRRVTFSSRTEHDFYAELRAIREQAQGR